MEKNQSINESVNVESLVVAQMFVNMFGLGYFLLKEKAKGIICAAVMTMICVLYVMNQDSVFYQGLYLVGAVISMIHVGILAHNHNKRIKGVAK